MPTIHDSLTVARSAILAQQKRLNAISNNIANVDTPGYHRQIAVLGSNPHVTPTIAEVRLYPVNSGVRVVNIVRAYNNIKETLLQEQIQDSSYHTQRSTALSDLEALIAGSGDSTLSNQLGALWNAWQDVANNSDSIAFRSVLMERGAALTDRVRSIAGNLQSFRDGLAAGAAPGFTGLIQSKVGEINTIATEIQDLNYRIGYSLSQYSPHSLQDRRDQLIRELSTLADITISSDYEIQIGGETLVFGETVSTATTNHNALTVNAIDNVAAPAVDFTLNGATVTINRGEVGALVSVVDKIDQLRKQLDTLTDSIITEVNALHSAGFDLDGNTGTDFFTGVDSDGDGLMDASSIAVNVLIHDPSDPMNDNPRAIAAAAGGPAVASGDGAIALQIAGLAHKQVAALNNQTLSEYFSGKLGALGASVQAARELAENGEAIVNMLTDSIQAETGVELDEEMIDLVSAQRAYAIACKLFSTIDEMMQTIIYQMQK